jgi:hypothetical protein
MPLSFRDLKIALKISSEQALFRLRHRTYETVVAFNSIQALLWRIKAMLALNIISRRVYVAISAFFRYRRGEKGLLVKVEITRRPRKEE